MKYLTLILLALVLFCTVKGVEAYTYVSGYYRSNGTYVNSYVRTSPNAYTFDNYSYKKPTYSNGYGYNSSYYTPKYNYSSSWYTPYRY